jgi:hypothetical protein
MYEQEIGQLATEIQHAVVKYKETNPNTSRRLVRVRRRDFTLKYREDIGFAHFPPERIEEDIWDWRDHERFQGSVVEVLEEYKTLISVLGPEKTGALERFTRDVSFTSFQGLDDKEITERVNALGRELESQPLPVTVTAFIDGLSIRESPFLISDRFLLRRPTPEDLAQYILLDEHGGFSFPLGDTWFRVVSELIVDAVYTGSAQMEFLRTLEALRLFRLGGIATNRYTMRSRHSYSGGTSGGGGRYSRYNYELAGCDSAPLNSFLRDLVPRFPDTSHPDKTTSEVEIAYARYKEALFGGGFAEQEITSAITALEALFLTGGQELTHRLAQRVSVFLRVLGSQTDAGSTYGNVAKGYKIRSKFIHGDSLKPSDRPQADSLARVLLEYARECVLAFFQLTTKKDDLLSQLDRAMIEPTAVSSLSASLKTVVHK